MTKIVLIGLLVALSLALKQSEVGVNDWAINTLGQVRELHFSKNKIHFVSNLGSIGILDKHTGNIEARSLVAESQKVVNYGDMRLIVATRYNQVVEHFITPTGLDKRSTNGFKVDSKSVQWVNNFDENGYFITKSSLHHGSQMVREATSDQIFLRVIEGKNTDGASIFYLLYRDTKQFNYCVQNIVNGSNDKYCAYSFGEEDIRFFEFYEGHVVLALNETTHILSNNLHLAVKEFNDKVVQFIDGAVVMLAQSYSLRKKTILNHRPVKSSRRDTQIYLLRSVDRITVYREDLELFSFHHNRNASISRAWFNFRSEMDYDLIIQYTDLELVSYAISKGHVEEQWKREQSLAYVQDILFMKYREVDTLDNQYHRHLLMHSYRDLSLAEKLTRVPQNLIMRITEEILDIKHFILASIDYIVMHLKNIDSSSIRKFEMPADQEIKYGLRKYLIVATQLNTIIAIDTKYHSILWKIDQQSNNEIVKFVQLKRQYDAEVAVLVTYNQRKGQTYIEQITEKGQVILLTTYQSNETPFIYKLNEHSIIVKIGASLQKYSVFQTEDVHEKQFFFYTLNESEIVGWKAVGGSVVKIWNFETRNDENIIKVASAFRGDQTSSIPLFDNEKVFFKNVDFTNLAVLTSYNKAIELYIINGRTGKVHFNTFKNFTSLNMPINLVYDENSVLVSYFNHRNKNFEIWTVEQYQERIETSALNMLSDYFKGNTYKPQESKERTIFEEEIFGSPVYIKHMEVSESKMSLTRRNLFIITGENQLYTIKRDFVSTRRPRPGAKNFFESEKFPEYTYFLPYQPVDYLSYYLRLATLNKIVFSPTDMESTIFTLCYGRDIFLIRNAPDKTFDMITEDFNHVVLILILIGATVGILAFKRLMNSAKIKKAHIE